MRLTSYRTDCLDGNFRDCGVERNPAENAQLVSSKDISQYGDDEVNPQKHLTICQDKCTVGVRFKDCIGSHSKPLDYSSKDSEARF